jgi:ketosteroid isomerase-like protein
MLQRSLLILLLTSTAVAVTIDRRADAGETDQIVALERAALDRWGRGEPEGYLELYARDVTYFDPQREKRVDGADAMRQLLMPIKGLVKVDHYEMIAPRVQQAGDASILTYNLVSHGRSPEGKAVVSRWNSTAVYQRIDGQWKIVHSHWSYTKPGPIAP